MTRAQHLLVILAEECAEVAKCASKAIRFGMDKFNPANDEENNREHLERELAEVVAVAELLGLKIKYHHKREKREKVEHYMEVSRECGQLHDSQEGKYEKR